VSSINHLGINENFPVAGQDNDTQVFRDNFDTIKTNLRIAGEEITDLEDNSARRDQDNDYANYVQLRAVFQNSREKKFDAGRDLDASPTSIEYANGNYQIFGFGANVNIDFSEFPGDPVIESSSTTVGKVTLELYGDGTERTINFITSGGTVIKKDSGFPGTVTVTSTTDPVFIEVWRHSSEVIYMRYLGQFS